MMLLNKALIIKMNITKIILKLGKFTLSKNIRTTIY